MKIEEFHKSFLTSRIAFLVTIVGFIALRLHGCEGLSLSWVIPLAAQLGVALLLLQLVHIFSIIRQRSLLPAFFYLLLTGTNSLFFYDWIGSLSSLLVAFCFFFLFDSYDNLRSQLHAFNIAALLTIGSLYWPPLLFCFPLFWAGMVRFRSMTFKTFLASLLGFVMVYLLLLTWSAYKDDWNIVLHFISQYKPLVDVQHWDIRSMLSTLPREWIREGFALILFSLSIWQILISGISEKIRTRTFLNYLYIFPLIVLFLVFFQSEGKKEWILISYMPLSLLIAHFFTFVVKEWTSWLLFFSILFFLVLYA